MRYLKLLLILPVASAIVGLAVINRSAVKLTYWPQQLGGELSLTLPLFVVLMLVLMVGVMLGSMATWLAQGSHRRAERQYRKEAERLKSEAERLKAMQPVSTEMMLPALKAR